MNRSRTIEQLEGHPWPEPPADCAPVVLRCSALRRVPIDQLATADLRVLLGQEVGTRFVLELALEALERDPLVESEYYPGDLLSNVLALRAEAWAGNTDWHRRALSVARRAHSLLVAESEHGGIRDRELHRDIEFFVGAPNV